MSSWKDHILIVTFPINPPPHWRNPKPYLVPLLPPLISGDWFKFLSVGAGLLPRPCQAGWLHHSGGKFVVFLCTYHDTWHLPGPEKWRKIWNFFWQCDQFWSPGVGCLGVENSWCSYFLLIKWITDPCTTSFPFLFEAKDQNSEFSRKTSQ